jgi:selenium metabolism protein YedF
MVNEVILIGSDMLGSSDGKLGRLLMSNFLRLLSQRQELPRYIILWNCGVKLAVVNSETVEFLKLLQDRGVEIISCRTCLEYFGLEDSVGAGEIDGMVRIQDVLSSHDVLAL